MSRANIVIMLTGSIACYKACDLISKLIKENFKVRCVVTESALEFIGVATLEALTGHPVHKGMFEAKMNIDHISLNKWADLFLICPATANTINKLSAGIADDLIGSSFLANNFKKPFWIAPAMNEGMYEHPITQKSIKSLEELGCFFFDVGEGRLACGDIGRGKLLEPALILEKIVEVFPCKS